jgi:FKBP-type peptidyl-prolyl cis-trans isomerase
MLDCQTPTVSSHNTRDFAMMKDTSIDRSQASNVRCSTQERIIKMADESLRQISNQLESSQRTSQSHLLEDKVATSSSQQSMSQTSQTSIKIKKNNFMPKDKNDGLISSMKQGVQVDILEKLRIQ